MGTPDAGGELSQGSAAVAPLLVDALVGGPEACRRELDAARDFGRRPVARQSFNFRENIREVVPEAG